MADTDARSDTTELKNQRLGRISFRAWRRGFREADLVLGPFADQVGPSLSDDELDAFEGLLNEDDQFLYGWIIEREPTPAEHDHTLMAKIRAFMRAHVAAEVAKGAG